MVWFKVDDSFWSHPKVLGLSGDAIALWVRAGSYCGQQLTDGVVSLQALRMLGERDHAVELTNAGLWEIDPTGGFRFHDWADYQPTREHVMEERKKATDRKRKSREASRQPSHRDSRGTDAVIGGRTPRTPPPTIDPALLSPFCPKHAPEGPGGKACRACGDSKMALVAAQAAAKAKPTGTPFTVEVGSICDANDHQWLSDNTCTKCTARKDDR